MKRLAIFFTVCLSMKSVLDFLPNPVVLASFCRVPAEIAAFYYGVPLETDTLAFAARGVTLAVTRACAATDFFSLVFAVLLTARLLRPCGWIRTVLSMLRREFPGLAAFGDRPVDGWYRLETEVGGKVAVPYRKGEGALVFAKVKGAKEDVSAWSDGAKLWARENEAFRKPALDVRKELLDGTRRTGVLTTQSAYLAVETSAQEKALKQKEMEALMGNKSFDFEEPSSGDAPGVLLLLGGFLAICVFGRSLSELMRRIKHI